MTVPPYTYSKCPCGHPGCSAYTLEGQGSVGFALGQARLMAKSPVMHDLLVRLKDAVEALDGTSVENEELVDEYRILMQDLLGG
jgi:hypothetical protein